MRTKGVDAQLIDLDDIMYDTSKKDFEGFIWTCYEIFAEEIYGQAN